MQVPIVTVKSLVLDYFNRSAIACVRSHLKSTRIKTWWIAVWPTRPASDHSRRKPTQTEPWTPMFLAPTRREAESHISETLGVPPCGLIKIEKD